MTPTLARLLQALPLPLLRLLPEAWALAVLSRPEPMPERL